MWDFTQPRNSADNVTTTFGLKDVLDAKVEMGTSLATIKSICAQIAYLKDQNHQICRALVVHAFAHRSTTTATLESTVVESVRLTND